MKQKRFVLGPGALVLALSLSPLALQAADEVISFEGIDPGHIVDQVATDSGLGPIEVFAINPDIPGTGEFGPDVIGNAAVIFDSANPIVTPSGFRVDFDLGTPNEDFGGPGVGEGGEAGRPFQNDTALGHLLIINEAYAFRDRKDDGFLDNADSPVTRYDDADNPNSPIMFDFSAIGPVTMKEMTIIDVEADEEDPATVELFDIEGDLVGMFELPQTGDNGVAVSSLGPTEDVAMMMVILNGSGAIDNLIFEVPTLGGQGCTPGYWKNHLDAWVGYDPGQSVDSVFAQATAFPELGSASLHEALQFGGGPRALGGAKILLRAAVASLLNASSPDVDFSWTAADVIGEVDGALMSGDRDIMLDLATELDFDNNLGCPLN